MDAKAAPATQDVIERVLELLEVAAEKSQAVNQENDVGTGELGNLTRCMPAAQNVEGVDPVAREDLLPGVEHRHDLLDDASHPFPVAACGDPSNVR